MSLVWLMSAGLPLGAVVGSYASTAALRAGRGEQSVTGRSRCDGCGRPLGFVQTIPIVSFMLEGGACSACAGSISRIHLAGELLGVAAVGLALWVAAAPRSLFLCALGLTLLSLALMDAKTRRLPDVLTAFVALMGAILAWTRSPPDLVVGAGAALIAFGLLQGVRLFFRARRGQDGMGFGDVKLIAALALWLGAATAWAVVIAGVLGLLAMAAIRPRDGRLPFGPAIALGAWSIGLCLEAGLWSVQ